MKLTDEKGVTYQKWIKTIYTYICTFITKHPSNKTSAPRYFDIQQKRSNSHIYFESSPNISCIVAKLDKITYKNCRIFIVTCYKQHLKAQMHAWSMWMYEKRIHILTFNDTSFACFVIFLCVTFLVRKIFGGFLVCSF